MAKRSIIKKLSKEQKSLLIGLLLGDGTISSNCVFKLSHSEAQREYLEWKVGLLDVHGIKNNGVKEYISSCGYNTGKKVLYSQMSLNPTIKANGIYSKETYNQEVIKLDNTSRFSYLVYGCINVNTSKQRSSIQHTIKIATCVDEDTVNVIIAYFAEVWDIKFRPFKEGRGTYSIATSSELDCDKFVNIVRPYIEQVPSLLYKIRRDSTKLEFIAQQRAASEARDTLELE